MAESAMATVAAAVEHHSAKVRTLRMTPHGYHEAHLSRRIGLPPLLRIAWLCGMSSGLGSQFKLDRADVAEVRVPPGGIVEALDVVADGGAVPRGEPPSYLAD